jgi:hypothetical protein
MEISHSATENQTKSGTTVPSVEVGISDKKKTLIVMILEFNIFFLACNIEDIY